MSHRCIDPFTYCDEIYPGGLAVGDDHPILRTHAAHFAKVNEPSATATEVASAAPAEVRAVKKAAPKKGAPKPEPKPEPAETSESKDDK